MHIIKVQYKRHLFDVITIRTRSTCSMIKLLLFNETTLIRYVLQRNIYEFIEVEYKLYA